MGEENGKAVRDGPLSTGDLRATVHLTRAACGQKQGAHGSENPKKTLLHLRYRGLFRAERGNGRLWGLLWLVIRPRCLRVASQLF